MQYQGNQYETQKKINIIKSSLQTFIQRQDIEIGQKSSAINAVTYLSYLNTLSLDKQIIMINQTPTLVKLFTGVQEPSSPNDTITINYNIQLAINWLL
jgi:hypothetical protein